MSKFKVGDKMRVIELDPKTRDEEYVELGDVLEIIKIDEIGDLWFTSNKIGTFGWRYFMRPNQVERVEGVGLSFGVKGYSFFYSKKKDPIESRIEEIQLRLDQLSEEIDRLMKEEQKLSQQMDTLREAQKIMKEV